MDTIRERELDTTPTERGAGGTATLDALEVKINELQERLDVVIERTSAILGDNRNAGAPVTDGDLHGRMETHFGYINVC